MALKTFKPQTPSNRYKEWNSFDEITKDSPEKSLTVALRRSGGRNNTGRITCRHIGGGHDKRYRLIDFKRLRRNEAAKVIGIEYDPNRSARIALVEYKDGERAYILAPAQLQLGSSVMAGENAAPEVGNALPLAKIPLGMSIHNIELVPGRGGVAARQKCRSMARVGRAQRWPGGCRGGHSDGRRRTDVGARCHCCNALAFSMGIADGVSGVRRAVREEMRQGADQIKIMMSGGVASLQPGDDAAALIARADAALYQAKQTGRDRVVRA
jgi:hypothetical protein